MRRIVYRYRISKFKRFANGLMFGIISIIALLLCLSAVTQSDVPQGNVVLSFVIAIVSMILGLFTMFRNGGVPKEKLQ